MILSEKIENLKHVFEPYIKVENKDILEFFNAGDLVTYEKNFIIKKENQKDEHLRILLDGIGGLFLVDNSGELKCVHFVFEDDLLTDYNSLTFDKPTKLIIKTLTKTTAFVISKDGLKKFLQYNTNALKVLHLGLEMIFEETFNRYLELLTLDATERYKLLINTRQDIIQQVDNKHIASYLGITPQSLSRLKRNI